MYRKFLLLIPLAFLIFACSNENIVDVSDIPGTYIANNPYGKDIIIVNSNGTYIHNFTYPGKDTESESGNWEVSIFNSIGILNFLGHSMISFHGFILKWEYPSEKPANWGGPIRRQDGKIYIDVNPDLHHYYVKE